MSPFYQQLRLKVGHDLLLIPGVAAVIRDDQGRLLLQEKTPGEGWSLPAGSIEPGESPQQALRREVLEETCLEVVPHKILGVFGGQEFRYTVPNGDIVEYTVVLFHCKVTREVNIARDPETKSLRYFSMKEMPPLAMPYPMDVLFGEQ